MGEEHNVVFGQGPKVNKAKSTPTSPSICLMRHIVGEVSVLLALLTLGPCPKTTLCSSPIVPNLYQEKLHPILPKYWKYLFSGQYNLYRSALLYTCSLTAAPDMIKTHVLLAGLYLGV